MSVFRCALAAVALAVFLPGHASAQVADSGRRLALVIGNETYASAPLKNPGNDARAMKSALTDAGFQVDLVTDVTLREMTAAINGFITRLRAGDVALFFYSGHGMAIEGENYLLPIDFAAQDEADARYTSYSASRILDRMEATGARMKVLVLDACRSNPFRVSRDRSGGLSAMSSTGRGSLIAFAAGPGGTADDNVSGNNGLFTLELLRTMREPGLGIEQVFARVRAAVDQASRGRQTPWTNSSLIGDFYFHAPSARPAPATVNVAASPSTAVAPSAGIPPSTLAIVRGADLNKAFNWAATSIDFKAAGADALARREMGLAVRRALSNAGVAATFYGELGIVWWDPSIDATDYVTQSFRPGATPAAKPPLAGTPPFVRLAYVDLQKIASDSSLGSALRVQVMAGGSTPAAQQEAQDTFQRALIPVLERVARTRGVQLLFSSNNDSGLAYADDRLDLTAAAIVALNEAGLGQAPEAPPQATAGLPGSAGAGVRYVNVQEIVNKSRLGREFTAQVQQATARGDSQASVAALTTRLQEDFGKVLVPVVSRHGTIAGLRVVFFSSDSGLVWADPGLNITDIIARELDLEPSSGASGQAPYPALPPPPPPPLTPVRVGGDIKEPAKLKDVRPDYPAIAQAARVQGAVILEATIGPDGRVQDTKVLRSIPLLDAAAINAVRQWVYTPTLLNNVPVPVIMTVTVTFSIQ